MDQQNIVIVKVGSNTLIGSDGNIRTMVVRNIMSALKEVQKNASRAVLVTSGAAKLGRAMLHDVSVSTAVSASIGQTALMHAYQREAISQKCHVAEILLTRSHLANRAAGKRLTALIADLFSHGVLPIINENDAVSAGTDESFSDNDSLASSLAIFLNAKKLIILTHGDGLFTDDPSTNPRAHMIQEVPDASAILLRFVSKTISDHGRGGMLSKIMAARLCTAIGITVHIVNGCVSGNLAKALDDEKLGTLFSARAPSKILTPKERWMLAAKNSNGSIEIDEGAERALRSGKSLLAVGVKKIYGQFQSGEIIEIINEKKRSIAFGIIKKSSEEIGACVGTPRAHGIELIHADNLFVLA